MPGGTMMFDLKTTVIALIGVAIFAAGWAVEGFRMGGQIADLQRERAEIERKAAEDNAADLTLAIERGDRLVEKLTATELARNELAQEKDDAIRRLTVGRRCLDSAAVRLLNDAMPTGIKAGDAPQAARQPVPADAGFATDTDVGIWVGQCQRAYDTCRGRLDAIADFYNNEAPLE